MIYSMQVHSPSFEKLELLNKSLIKKNYVDTKSEMKSEKLKIVSTNNNEY